MLLNEQTTDFVKTFIEIHKSDGSRWEKMYRLKSYVRDRGNGYDKYAKIFDCELPLGVVAICRGRCRVIQFPKIDYGKHIEFSNLFRALLLEYCFLHRTCIYPLITLTINYREIDIGKIRREFTPDGERLAEQLQCGEIEYPITQILIGDVTAGFRNGIEKK